MKFATKRYDITHLTLGVWLRYLGKLKILCRYSDIKVGTFFETQCIHGMQSEGYNRRQTRNDALT